MNMPAAAVPAPGAVQPLVPATARGEATRRKLLDAAEAEFGAKGFHAASISSITLRAGVGQGTFYLYFHSKEEIFAVVVRGIGDTLRRQMAQTTLRHGGDRERTALETFLDFARRDPGLFRIVQEAQFVDEAAFREYYENLARGFGADDASDGGIRAWALIGAGHFLGLRHCLWQERPAEAAVLAQRLFGAVAPTCG